MISPTPRIRRHDSPFPKVQETWIIQQSAFFYAKSASPCIHPQIFWQWRPQEGAGKSHFLEAHSMVWRDRSWAVTGKAKTDEDRRTTITEENIKIVKDYFMEIEKHPQSLRPLVSLLFQSLDHPARPHKTEDVLTFLRLNFKGSVISRRSEIKWPPYSPDLNFSDYFWLYAMINVRRCKPATIEELGAVVKSVARTFLVRMIRTAVANVQKRMHPVGRGPLWSLTLTAFVVLHYPCIY